LERILCSLGPCLASSMRMRDVKLVWGDSINMAIHFSRLSL
jgi:hypothetical protein